MSEIASGQIPLNSGKSDLNSGRRNKVLFSLILLLLLVSLGFNLYFFLNQYFYKSNIPPIVSDGENLNSPNPQSASSIFDFQTGMFLGEVTETDGSSVVVKNTNGVTRQLKLANKINILKLDLSTNKILNAAGDKKQLYIT